MYSVQQLASRRQVESVAAVSLSTEDTSSVISLFGVSLMALLVFQKYFYCVFAGKLRLALFEDWNVVD